LELYQVLNKRGVDYITNEKALVMRIAKRKIARYYSLLERLQSFVSISIPYDENSNHEEIDFEAESMLTEDFSIQQDTLETAKQYIQSKPEDIQKVFYLRYNADLPITEIAQALKISESNVKNKLYRTLNELRNILKDEVPL
jgi:RNA polymerase sigma-70 factor (ECF subfamily)